MSSILRHDRTLGQVSGGFKRLKPASHTILRPGRMRWTCGVTAVVENAHCKPNAFLKNGKKNQRKILRGCFNSEPVVLMGIQSRSKAEADRGEIAC